MYTINGRTLTSDQVFQLALIEQERAEAAEAERDTLRARLAAEEAAHRDDVAALRERLNKIKSDERLSYKTATVHENAPLALIQVELEARVSELERTLKIISHEAQS